MKRPFNFFIGNILWILCLTSVLKNNNAGVSVLLLVAALLNIWVGMWGIK